jgi:hypothetical protein
MKHQSSLAASLKQIACGPIVLIGIGLSLSGCNATRLPNEAEQGVTVRAALAQQVIDPQASGLYRAPSGLAGAAAKASVDRYVRSFEVPAASSNVFAIGVGSGAAGSTAAPAASPSRQ